VLITLYSVYFIVNVILSLSDHYIGRGPAITAHGSLDFKQEIQIQITLGFFCVCFFFVCFLFCWLVFVLPKEVSKASRK
jgi:hypothetical protein